MRILWFSVTPSLWGHDMTGHNGGGWIASLENLIAKSSGVELGIAFEYRDNRFKCKQNNVTYYPIAELLSGYKGIARKFSVAVEEEYMIPACLKIIDDFQPDLIQVFGSEWSFGLLSEFTDIPIVIHIQGNLLAYSNARFPAGYSKYDYIFSNGFNFLKIFRSLNRDRKFSVNACREERILHNCKNFMGRTEWDKNIVQLYAPDSSYYHCNETLRQVFTQSDHHWKPSVHPQIMLISVISQPLYKGVDTILKTAKILKQKSTIDFVWKVFGISEMSFHEKKNNIEGRVVNVVPMGTASDETLKNEMLKADIFIHPSYIDNSPNSVCEAQILGLPVICANVGGVSSLVRHAETGFLFPSNDPFTLAIYVKKMIEDKQYAAKIGENARHEALMRHNPDSILANLLAIYETIIRKG